VYGFQKDLFKSSIALKKEGFSEIYECFSDQLSFTKDFYFKIGQTHIFIAATR